jgi:alkylation response protein AidB-like acyl-CoA dehydrogenase
VGYTDYGDTAEQAELRAAVRDFMARAGALPADEVWKRLAGELGLCGLGVPERLGGAGAGLGEVAVAVAEAGRVLLPLPVLSTALAGAVLGEAADPGTAGVLTGIADGSVRAAFVLGDVDMADGRVSGVVEHVLDGADADVFLVGRALTRSSGLNCAIDTVARGVAGGVAGMYVVRAADIGVTVSAAGTLDQTRSQATVSFAAVPGLAVDVNPARAEDLLRVMLAVESAAAAEHCLDVTVEYLKTRTQFGRALGTFQALRHRCADLAVEVASAVATARAAVARPDDLAVLGPLAKKHCADVFWHVAAEMVQLHGGIGFTWEHQAHRYLKRAKTTQLLHGSPAELRRLVAERAGVTDVT